MSVQPGNALGHYRIAAAIGAGGMGEVYRATDTKLGREVAIKVLPDEVAGNEERLARFEREAHVLASLNHPNIATLFGFETEGDTSFLIMELVEGETLAERIARGPIPVDEALPLFVQIAEGLEAAHESGIIHRDLKPANVKITDDSSAAPGRIKILDFGLAKAMEPEVPVTDLSHSPTLTAAATRRGEILGTAAYMSPEQARGKQIDRRCDVWAFGCCLYEALAGSRAFRGSDTTDLLAAVLKEEPDWKALPGELAWKVRDLLGRCLQKDPRQRLHDIADARLEIEEALQEDTPAPALFEGTARKLRWRWSLVGLLSGLLAGATLVGLLMRRDQDSSDTGLGLPRRSSIQLETTAPLSLANSQLLAIARTSLAISPDGTLLVYAADLEGRTQLYLRPLQVFEATPIAGTEGAFSPIFSPDGAWVAFFADDYLKKVSLQGGDPELLCEAKNPFDATWGEDDWIYFVRQESRLSRVSSSGGAPEELTDVLFTPDVLPDGRGLLVTKRRSGSVDGTYANVVHFIPGGEQTTLLEGGYRGRYVPSGHIVYVRSGGLFAVPFDLDRMHVGGPPVSIQDGVWTDSIYLGAQFSFSAEGTLVYVPGGDWARTVPTWIDREGRVESLPLEAAVYNTVRLSPGARLLAMQVTGPSDQIYVYDFRRETSARLTLRGGNRSQRWTRDGERVIFSSSPSAVGGEAGLFWMPVDGSGDPELLLQHPFERTAEHGTAGPTTCGKQSANSVSPDGQVLAFTCRHPVRKLDVWLLSLGDEREPEPFVATEAREWGGAFSPDGRWLAYTSDKTGRYEIFVRPYPLGDREWQVSSGGGEEPSWSPRRDELFYRDGNRLMVVSISIEPDFVAGTPRVLLEADFYNSGGISYDVSPDGQRFLVNKPVIAGGPVTEIRMVTHWFEELERLVPTGN